MMFHCWNSVVALCLSCKICLCAVTVGSDISHEKPTTSAVSLASEQQDVSSAVSSAGYPFEVTAYLEVPPTDKQQDVAAPMSAVPLTSGNTEVSPTDEQQDVAAHVSYELPTLGNFLEQPDNCEVSRTVYSNDVGQVMSTFKYQEHLQGSSGDRRDVMPAWSSPSFSSLLHDCNTVLYSCTASTLESQQIFNPVDDPSNEYMWLDSQSTTLTKLQEPCCQSEYTFLTYNVKCCVKDMLVLTCCKPVFFHCCKALSSSHCMLLQTVCFRRVTTTSVRSRRPECKIE